MIDAGRVTKVEVYDNGTFVEEDISDMPFEDVLKLCNIYNRKNRRYTHFLVDTSPFSYEDFDETKEDTLRMKQRVIELGFKLSDEELKHWDDYIAYRFDDED